MLPCSVLLFGLSSRIISVLPVFSLPFLSTFSPNTSNSHRVAKGNEQQKLSHGDSLYFILPHKTVTHLLNQAQRSCTSETDLGEENTWISTRGWRCKAQMGWENSQGRERGRDRVGMGLEEESAAALGFRTFLMLLPAPSEGSRGALQNYRLFSSSNLVNQKINWKTNSVYCFL